MEKIRDVLLRNLDEEPKGKLLRCFQNILIKEDHVLLPKEPENPIREAFSGIVGQMSILMN